MRMVVDQNNMKDNIIRLRKGRLGRLKPCHPWIYKRQIIAPNPSVKPGSMVSVVNAEGGFIGRGYYNPRSDISIRILTFIDEPIDKGFFDKRIEKAFRKREKLREKTNAYRAVFSEGDSLPGLVIDVYRDIAVFQVSTLGMENFKKIIANSIQDVLKPAYIYEKSTSPFRRLEGLKDSKSWWGRNGSAEVEMFEGRARFIVDIEKGHKTGFYLDQRKSRMAMEGISKGRKVLDLFCYTGGFPISAALYGAASVRGIDIKKEWLGLARRNVVLNGVSAKTEFIEGDAFSLSKKIYNSGEKFDMIVIDPPSFMKARKDMVSASKAYKELNLTAMQSLADGGILITFSCSHNMPNEAFSDILKSAAKDAGKRTRVLRRCHQAEDHPIAKAIPETEYLKGYFLEVNPG